MKTDRYYSLFLTFVLLIVAALMSEHKSRIIELETKLNSKLEICTGHKRIADRKFVPTNCYLVVSDD